MRLEEEIKQSRFRNEFHKLILNLTYTGSWLNIQEIQFFRQYDLSPQQYNILRILRGQYPKPASINLLIERMMDKMSNASRLVDKLEAKELVVRKTCQADRRQVDVMISEKGLKLLEQLDREVEGLEEKFIRLSEQEARQINDLLDKMRG